MNKELNKLMLQAVKNGDVHLVKELLTHNEGLLNEICLWGTWLQNAAAYGKYDVAEYLIVCGIDVNSKAGIFNESALKKAASGGYLDVVELLLKNGAEMDVSDWNCNPLFSAIHNGHLDVVKCLVENGFDLIPKYEIRQYDDVDALKYARMNGKKEIEEYLRDKLGVSEIQCSAKKTSTKEVTWEGNLNKQRFIGLFKGAVQDIYPQIKEKYREESIYGISFEVANTVCKVYTEDFGTNIYLNTEEHYQQAIADCSEEKQGYYRFSVWAEWIPEAADTELFKELQEYLQTNCTHKDEDIERIRRWQAEALGQIRAEGFWEQQGNPDIQVIPFEGEDEISVDELTENYKEMDRGYHDGEYWEYLGGL